MNLGLLSDSGCWDDLSAFWEPKNAKLPSDIENDAYITGDICDAYDWGYWNLIFSLISE